MELGDGYKSMNEDFSPSYGDNSAIACVEVTARRRKDGSFSS
jgi:hypothetical protein